MFQTGDKDHALNQDLVTQANSGRVANWLVNLASAKHGLVIPVAKPAFDRWGIVNFGAQGFTSDVVTGEAYYAAVQEIRKIMGLSPLPACVWIDAIKAAKAETKAKAAATRAANKEKALAFAKPTTPADKPAVESDSPALDTAIALMQTLTHAEVKALMLACQTRMDAPF